MDKKKGFTVVELTIVVSLTALLIGIVGSMVSLGSNMIRYSDNKSTLQRQAENIQEKISNIGMQAKSFNKVEDGKYEVNSYGGSHTIEINKNDIKINGISYLGNDYDKKNVLVENIVVDDKTSIVKISFNLTKGSYKNKVNYPINITFCLRNL